MSDVIIAAKLDIASDESDLEGIGKKLDDFLSATGSDGVNPATVALTVADIDEDGDVFLSIPGILNLWIPRWQLEQALRMTKAVSK